MKIVVLGGTGLIGSRLVALLRERGHDVVAASPSTGVNAVSGAGLPDALTGASVVADVSNSPSLEKEAALAFFEASSRNLLPAAVAAGVRHHVCLSAIGTNRLPESGYFRAKMFQENTVRTSDLPYTIVRSAPFYEYLNSIMEGGSDGEVLRISSAQVQPVAGDDVARALLDIVLSDPQNTEVEIAGPDRFRLTDLAQQILTANWDPRMVVADLQALYFGAILRDDTLIPGGHPRYAPTRFDDWLRLYVAGPLSDGIIATPMNRQAAIANMEPVPPFDDLQ